MPRLAKTKAVTPVEGEGRRIALAMEKQRKDNQARELLKIERAKLVREAVYSESVQNEQLEARLARLREEVRVLEEKGGLISSSTKVGSPVSTTSTILNKAFSLPTLLKKHSFSEIKPEVTSAEYEDGEEDLSKLVLSEQEKLADRRKAFDLRQRQLAQLRRHKLYEAQVNAGLVPKYEAVDRENPENSMAAAEFTCVPGLSVLRFIGELEASTIQEFPVLNQHSSDADFKACNGLKESSHNFVLDSLKSKAKVRGANGIVGLRFETTPLDDVRKIEICAYGTAVILDGRGQEVASTSKVPFSSRFASMHEKVSSPVERDSAPKFSPEVVTTPINAMGYRVGEAPEWRKEAREAAARHQMDFSPGSYGAATSPILTGNASPHSAIRTPGDSTGQRFGNADLGGTSQQAKFSQGKVPTGKDFTGLQYSPASAANVRLLPPSPRIIPIPISPKVKPNTQSTIEDLSAMLDRLKSPV